MSRINPVEVAFRRREMLVRILKWVRTQALTNPAQSRWAELGLRSAYESKEASVSELNDSFDQLFGLLEHLAIIDMASSFELAGKRRLSTRIGEARTDLSESAKKGASAPQLENLLRSSEDYDSLKAIEDFVSRYAEKSVADSLALVRSARNNFAHGTDILSAPVIDSDRARENLKDVLDLI